MISPIKYFTEKMSNDIKVHNRSELISDESIKLFQKNKGRPQKAFLDRPTFLFDFKMSNLEY